MIKISALNEVSTGKEEEEDVTTITKEAQVRINFNYTLHPNITYQPMLQMYTKCLFLQFSCRLSLV